MQKDFSFLGDTKQIVDIIFLDLSKAFDVIYDRLLISKIGFFHISSSLTIGGVILGKLFNDGSD